MAKCVGICSMNFLDEDYLAHRNYSSQRTAYPAENAYNLNRRSMVWRTDGYFLVVSGENDIVFREQLGVDLTATVAAGAYTSLTAFLAAVETALEAVGAAGYTVDTNNGKIRITSDLGGGAAVFQLRMASTDPEMAAMLGFEAVNAFTGLSAYTADLMSIHEQEWLEWDLGFPANPKAFILAGDRNSPLKVSPGAVVKLQGNPTNNWSVAPQYEATITMDDFVLAKWDLINGLAGSGSAGYRYWRAQIVDPQNPRGYTEIGLAYLGDCIVTTRGCAVFPLGYQIQDPSTTVFAEAGQVFTQELPATEGLQIQWNALTKQEEQELRQFCERVKKVRAWFIILDSDEQTDGTGAFSVNQREWVKLVRFSQDMQFSLESPNFFTSPWQVREEV